MKCHCVTGDDESNSMHRERLTGTKWEHRDGQKLCSLTCVQSGRDGTFAAFEKSFKV